MSLLDGEDQLESSWYACPYWCKSSEGSVEPMQAGSAQKVVTGIERSDILVIDLERGLLK